MTCTPQLMLAAIVAVIAAMLAGLILWPLVATLLEPTEAERQQDDAAIDSVRAALETARREDAA